MINKKDGFTQLCTRASFPVDTSVEIQAGMIAFLTTDANGATVATTAAGSSGGVPIGAFWKDAASTYVKTWVESGTFNANGIIMLSKGNVHSASEIKVTNAAETVTYTQGADYSVSLTNGVLTNLSGLIPALGTVHVFYAYSVVAGREFWENAGTKWSMGSNYDRMPDDTLGSGKIAVLQGNATFYTDQWETGDTFALNDALRCNMTSSRWTNSAVGSSVCGRVIKVPTTSDPFLGVEMIRIAQ